MDDICPRLTLLTPPVSDAGLVGALDAACAAGDVAAVILRLAPADDRALTDLVRPYATAVQAHGAALVIACADSRAELATVATRGGADGVHLDLANEKALATLRRLRDDLPKGRILGVGTLLTRDDAMAAGEAGVDYVLFGETDSKGRRPSLEDVRERAAWWAEIFETPCIAVAATPDAVGPLGATGAEFVGLDPALWAGPGGADAVAAALAALGQDPAA